MGSEKLPIVTTPLNDMLVNFTSTILPNIIKHVNNVTFSWYDYILFTLMLTFSAIIGIYFGCFGSKQSTAKEYLMGGKTMKVIPIAISLVASHTSGITLLALPADVYRYGAGYWLGSFSMILLCAITIYVYLPVFFNLQITSTYEYLERRFDNRTRMFASFLYGLSVFLYLPIVVYIPALAFSAATGINVHLITPLVCGICIFYTTIGGLKAVVWTDTLQFSITVGAVATVFVLGVQSAGGFLNVWNTAIEGERLDIFDFDFDPTKRDSFWIILIGLTVHWVGHTSVNQGCIQKFLAVPTFHDAKMAVIYFGIGMTIMKTASVLTGLVMFAKYHDCDPFTVKEVSRNDQLLPYYVMDVARNIPGLSGLFIAGIFSAALSTLSASLNCLAGTIYEDFIKKFMNVGTSEKTASNILKLIVIVTGVISTALVFVIEHLGGLLPLAISLQSVSNGPLLAMFTIGLLFPRATPNGAFYGAIGGMIGTGWIVFTARYYEARNLFKYNPKPLSVNGCDFLVNSTLIINETSTVFPSFFLNESTTVSPSINNSTTELPFFLFRISHYYYNLIGTVISMIIGLIISYSSKEDSKVDRALITPVVNYFTKKDNKDTETINYYTVEKALNMVEVNGERNSNLQT